MISDEGNPISRGKERRAERQALERAGNSQRTGWVRRIPIRRE
jgi:hypothetical protein